MPRYRLVGARATEAVTEIPATTLNEYAKKSYRYLRLSIVIMVAALIVSVNKALPSGSETRQRGAQDHMLTGRAVSLPEIAF